MVGHTKHAVAIALLRNMIVTHNNFIFHWQVLGKELWAGCFFNRFRLTVNCLEIDRAYVKDNSLRQEICSTVSDYNKNVYRCIKEIQ